MRRNRSRPLLVVVAASLCLTGADWPGRERELAAEIDTAPPARRIELLTEIAASTSRDAEATIVRALADPEPAVRLAAAQLAGRHRYRAAREILAAWLGDSLGDVRAVAARSLGALGDARSLPAIVRLLGDADVDVRRAAVSAVAAIGGPDATVPLLNRLADAESAVRVDTARTLGDLGDPRAVLSLLGALQDSMPEVREATAVALGKLHDPRAVRGLLGLLRDAQLDVRVAATRALGTLGSPDAVLDLAPLALDIDRAGASARTPMALTAIEAIGRIGGAVARDVLVRVYLQSEGSLDIARASADALRSMGPAGRAAIPLLTVRPVPPALLAPPAREGAGYIDLLGDLGGDEAATALVALYDGPDGPSHGEVILRALGRTGARQALAVLLRAVGAPAVAREGAAAERVDVSRRGAVAGLTAYLRVHGSLDSEALDPLVSALQRPPRELLGDAARAFVVEVTRLIGETHNARATAILAPMLASRQTELRAAAARALGVVGVTGAERALTNALSDASIVVRTEAADALARFGGREALDALIVRWSDGRPLDRVHAARSIGRIGARTHDPRAAALLTDLLPRASRETGAAVLDALASLASSGDDRAYAALRDASSNDAFDVEALGALGNALDGAPPAMRITIRDTLIARASSGGDPSRVATALWGLSHGDASAQAALLAHATDPSPYVATNAMGALARLWSNGVAADPAGRPTLCEHVLTRRHPTVRANALLAATRAGWSCARPDVLRRMLTDGRADFVRHAAIDALALSVRTATGDELALARTELSQCAAVDRSPAISAHCAAALATSPTASSAPPAEASNRPASDPEGVEALVTRDDEEHLALGVPVALVFRDGVTRIAWTGADGWVHDRPSPRGSYLVLEADTLGLEP